MIRYNGGRVLVNYSNINYLSYKNDKLYYYYRPKLKMEEYQLPEEYASTTDADRVLNPMGLYNLKGYYINVNRIALTTEQEIPDNKVFVSIYFSDNVVFDITLPKDFWIMFKNHRLV